jgi:hypothetical protein
MAITFVQAAQNQSQSGGASITLTFGWRRPSSKEEAVDRAEAKFNGETEI